MTMLLSLLPGLLSGCAGPDDPAHLNIVVIHVDTLRRDRLPIYGYARPTMPLMAEWPWQRVDGYTSASSWTVPSVASVMSGLEPHRHGVNSAQPTTFLDAPTFIADLRAAGYRTRLVTGNNMLSRGLGLEKDFEELTTIEEKDGDMLEVVDAAVSGLPAHRPFFLWVQPMDPHTPYNPPAQDRGRWATDPPFDMGKDIDNEYVTTVYAAEDEAGRAALTQSVRDIYDEQLPGLDRGIDGLLRDLRQRGLLDNTLVVLAADHGEMLGEEPGTFGHGERLRPELVRLPLLWMPPLDRPDLVFLPADCSGQSQDLGQTLLAMVNLPLMPGVDGIDLRAGCRSGGRHMILEDVLTGVAISTPEVELSWMCDRSRLEAWRLEPEIADLDPADPAAAALLPGLRLYEQEIAASLPADQGCAAPVP